MSVTITLEDHEIAAMRRLTYYLPAIARSLQLEGSDIAAKLLNWNAMLQDVLDRIDTKGNHNGWTSE